MRKRSGREGKVFQVRLDIDTYCDSSSFWFPISVSVEWSSRSWIIFMAIFDNNGRDGKTTATNLTDIICYEREGCNSSEIH